MHPIAVYIQDLKQQQNLLLQFFETCKTTAEAHAVMQELLSIKIRLVYYQKLEPKY